MAREDGKVAEMLDGLVGSQQLSIVCTVFMLGWFIFLEKNARGFQALLTRCCSTALMVVVEASVTTASCADGSGWASSVALLECLVEFRHPGNGMRAFDSGAGKNVMEWCLSTSSLWQESSIKV
jgi:hypothetical protein